MVFLAYVFAYVSVKLMYKFYKYLLDWMGEIPPYCRDICFPFLWQDLLVLC